jgi:hypothetical protein
VDATSYSGEEAYSMKPEYYRVPLDVFKLSRKEDKWPLKSDIDIDDVDNFCDIEVPFNSQSEVCSDGNAIQNDCKNSDFEHESVENGESDNVWTRGDFVLK